MRASYPSIFLFGSVTFLAPCAHGNTLVPGPLGSASAGESFLLTLDGGGHGGARSYLVDRKGFYEEDVWTRSDGGRRGGSNDAEGRRETGSSSILSLSSSKRLTGFGAISGLEGFSRSASDGPSLTGGGGIFSMKGLEEGAGLASGGLGIPSRPGITADTFAFGSGRSNAGFGNPASVSTTPLPASWTMMLIGLCGFSYLARRSRKKGSAVAAA